MLGMERIRHRLAQWSFLLPLRLVCKMMGYARAFTGAGRFLRDDAALLALRRHRRSRV
jgi:hypothetical protein